MFWDHLKSMFDLSYSYLGTIWIIFEDNFRDILGIILRLFEGRFGIMLETVWKHFAIILKGLWNRFGPI